MRKAKASVVWELLDVEGAQRLVVDVDAPLRPFGADPTPPQGTAMPGRLDGPGAADEAASLRDDTLLDLELPVEPPAPPPLPATEALLRALRGKSRRE